MVIDDQHRRRAPQSLAVVLATGLGVGLVAPAPGTVASLLWGMPLAWAVGCVPGWRWQLLAVFLLCLVGVPLCTRAGRDLGGKKDNQAIVWDEIVTVPIMFLAVPLRSWGIAIIGFVLLRVIDISKPPPIRSLELLPEGRGIMADDVLAGIYAMVALVLVDRLF